MDKTIDMKPAQTQILQIFRLKAGHPEKYREDIKVMNADVPFQMLDRLKEVAGQERQRQAALEAASVEAVYTDITPAPEQTIPVPPPTPAPPPAPPQPPRAWRTPPRKPDSGDPPGRMTRR